jgi:hypothetical protein
MIGVVIMDKQRMDDLFDDIFDEALAEEMDIEIPDPDASWDRMSARIDRQGRKRRVKKRLQMAVLVAAAAMLGASIFGKPQQTEAFLPVTKFLNEFREDVISIFTGDKKKLEEPPKGMLTAPPPSGVGPVMGQNQEDLSEEKRITFQSIEDAQGVTKTALPAVGYVPDGYEFKNITLVLSSSQKMLSDTRLYSTADGQDFLSLSVSAIMQDLLTSVSVDKEKDKVEKIWVNNYEGVMITKPGRGTTLMWNTPSISFNLVANKLDANTVVKIAQSIK